MGVPVPTLQFGSSLTLEACLDSFASPEELAVEDRVRCEKTQQLERSIKKLDVWTAPECLVIHLKRFRSHGRACGTEKVSTHVEIPMTLDFAEWVNGPTKDASHKYWLRAVVDHFG